MCQKRWLIRTILSRISDGTHSRSKNFTETIPILAPHDVTPYCQRLLRNCQLCQCRRRTQKPLAAYYNPWSNNFDHRMFNQPFLLRISSRLPKSWKRIRIIVSLNRFQRVSNYECQFSVHSCVFVVYRIRMERFQTLFRF